MLPLAHPNNIKTPNTTEIESVITKVDNKIRSLLGKHQKEAFSALSTVNDPEKNNKCLNDLTGVLIVDMQDWMKKALSGFTAEEYNHVVGVAVSKLRITTSPIINVESESEEDDDPTMLETPHAKRDSEEPTS
jgi:hypothetical protein